MSVEVNGSQESARLMRLATYASVSVASVLIVAKVIAWVMTDSMSLLSTLVDSFLDVLASLVNLYAVKHALEPADAEHRFGHGKAEPLAGLAQAAFIGGSSVFLLLQATERMINPRPIANLETGIGVMGFAIVLTLALVIFQRYVVKKTGSVAISADSLHYQSDLLVNVGVRADLSPYAPAWGKDQSSAMHTRMLGRWLVGCAAAVKGTAHHVIAQNKRMERM